MASKLVLYVSAQHATAARWLGKSLSSSEVFDNDEAGYAAFSRYLADVARMPVYVTVDAVEEDYRFEAMPHSFGSDRAEMVSRKLKQLFRGTPYSTCWLQGRDSGKRRDDRYLFAALTNPDLISPWLQIITAHKLPVAGVYLLPMVSQALVQELRLEVRNFLLVAHHGSALRLSFFRDNQLRISRLTRVENADPASRVKIFTEEIANTRLYLHTLRVMTLDEPLTIVLLDRTDSLADLVQTIARDSPHIRCLRLSRGELAAKLRIPEQTLAGPADAMYLHLLGLRVPPGNLAPPTLTETFDELRMRRMVYAAAGAAAVVCVTWSAVNAYRIYDLNATAATAEISRAARQKDYFRVTRQFPAAPTSAENLQRAVGLAQEIKKSTRTPELMMSIVSRALDEYPEVDVKSFGWRYAPQEIDPEAAQNKAVREAPQTPASTPPAAPTRRQSGFIDGEIKSSKRDYRSAIAKINSFAERLQREEPVAEVRVVKYPLNVSPSTALSGDTQDTQNRDSLNAPFKIIIVLKPSV